MSDDKEFFWVFVDRVYQKNPETVRVEHKVGEPMGLEQLLRLLDGGGEYYTQQSLFFLIQHQQSMMETLKFTNQSLVRLVRHSLFRGAFQRALEALVSPWEGP